MGWKKTLATLALAGSFVSGHTPVTKTSSYSLTQAQKKKLEELRIENKLVHKPTFVLVAGHSDDFPGKHYRGIKEEQVTLEMTLEFGKKFDTTEYNIIYARTDGRALTTKSSIDDLEKRAQLAMDIRPDAYISFHLNYSRDWRTRHKDDIELHVLGLKGFKEMNDGKNQQYFLHDFKDTSKKDIYSRSTFAFAKGFEEYVESISDVEVTVKARGYRELYQHPILLGRNAKWKVSRVKNNASIELPTVAVIYESYWLQNAKHRDSLKDKNYGRLNLMYHYLTNIYRPTYATVPLLVQDTTLKEVVKEHQIKPLENITIPRKNIPRKEKKKKIFQKLFGN